VAAVLAAHQMLVEQELLGKALLAVQGNHLLLMGLEAVAVLVL
jgi:hypothetical protein